MEFSSKRCPFPRLRGFRGRSGKVAVEKPKPTEIKQKNDETKRIHGILSATSSFSSFKGVLRAGVSRAGLSCHLNPCAGKPLAHGSFFSLSGLSCLPVCPLLAWALSLTSPYSLAKVAQICQIQLRIVSLH